MVQKQKQKQKQNKKKKKKNHYNQYVEVWQGHRNSSVTNYCGPRNKLYVKRKKEKPHYMQHIIGTSRNRVEFKQMVLNIRGLSGL